MVPKAAEHVGFALEQLERLPFLCGSRVEHLDGDELAIGEVAGEQGLGEGSPAEWPDDLVAIGDGHVPKSVT